MISFDDFKKIEITLGEIKSAEHIEGSDKLLKLSVDFNEESPRQIISGISHYFPEVEGLVGMKVVFVTNIEPRMIFGFESQGMILGLHDENGGFALLTPHTDVPIGIQAT